MENLFKCPKCGESTGNEDYCPNCGEPLTLVCQKCGTKWRYWQNIKFCPNCGTKSENIGVSPAVKK